MEKSRAYIAHLLKVNGIGEKYADSLALQVDGYLRNMGAIRESGKYDEVDPIFSHAQIRKT